MYMKWFKSIPKNNEMISINHKQMRFMLVKQFLYGLLLGFIIREILFRL
jgi:hypothetical protein